MEKAKVSKRHILIFIVIFLIAEFSILSIEGVMLAAGALSFSWFVIHLTVFTAVAVGSLAFVYFWVGRVLDKHQVSERRYRSFIENFQGIAFRGDKDFSVDLFHGNVEETTGYKGSDFLSGKVVWPDIVHPDDLPGYLELITDYIDSGDPASSKREYRIVRKDGKTAWVRESVRLIEGLEGIHKVDGVIIDISDRKTAEEALKESEKKFRFMTESMNDISFTVDMNLNTTYVSDNVERILGFTPEERMKQQVNEQVTPQSLERIGRRLAEELEKDNEEDVDINRKVVEEVDYYHKDGSIVTLETTASFIRDEDGSPIGIYGLSRDITERKRAEKAIKESEEQFRQIAEVSFTGILVHDGSGVVYVNDRFLEMAGYPREFFKGTGEAFDLLVPEDREQVAECAQRVLRGEPLEKPCNVRVVRKDGEIIEAQITITLINIQENPAMMILVHDISDLKKAEKELRESEEKHRFLAESTADVIWMLDMNLELAYISPAVQRQRGYTVEEAMEQSLDEMLTPESHENAMNALSGILDEENEEYERDRILTLDLAQYRKDGSLLWTEMSMRFLLDDEGTPVGILGVTRDISERRKSEEELRRKNAELEGFAQTVSHDLKGPLAAIDLVSETLKEFVEAPLTDETQSEISEAINLITKNVNKSRNLIDDLLSLAKAGQAPEDVSRIEVGEIVSKVVTENEGIIGERGIVVDVDANLGRVTANPTHIYQIFSNLISNAIRYNSSHSPVIEISYLGSDENGFHRYLVKDNGPGIPPEDLEKIFLPFFKGKGGDTGIGLSTVERIINVYGGDIKAYNDNGAAFELFLKDFENE